MNVHDLPAVNASLNALAAMYLLWGWFAIKRQDREVHAKCMVMALLCSALFLACYLYYHYNAGAMTRYQGDGIDRLLYFAILITHVPLAALMVPFILAAVYYAYRHRFDAHTRITRYLWPVWMYVSVTGVLIFIMLYVLQ